MTGRSNTTGPKTIVLSALVLLVASGCGPGGDTSLFVRNDSDREWFVSVQRTQGDDPFSRWVIRVQPGADGFGVSWAGGPNIPVSVLDADCAPVGQFERSDDGSYAVEAAPGLTARIEDRPGPWLSRTQTPRIQDTDACGGFVPR